MPFAFRLQTHLRLKEADRDRQRAELADAMRTQASLLAQAKQLARERHEAADWTRRLASPGQADVQRLLASHRYDQVLRTLGVQLSAQLADVQADIEQRRLALVEADRRVQLLEKLRDRRRAEFDSREAMRAQRQFDEQAVIAYVRCAATR